MRNFLLIAILGFSLNLVAQMQIPELKFIFDSKSDFTEQFLDKENSKQFTFKVEGVSSAIDKQALVHMVKNSRGVENFILEISSNGDLIGKLTVYRYATGWWYFETFMKKAGIPTFQIEQTNYNINTINTIE